MAGFVSLLTPHVIHGFSGNSLLAFSGGRLPCAGVFDFAVQRMAAHDSERRIRRVVFRLDRGPRPLRSRPGRGIPIYHRRLATSYTFADKAMREYHDFTAIRALKPKRRWSAL